MSQPPRNYEQVFEDLAKNVEENFRHDGYIVPFLFIENRKGELVATEAGLGG